jgi:hypothetical protein
MQTVPGGSQKQPPKNHCCMLPRVGQSIFCDEIISFLPPLEIVSLVRNVKEVSHLYSLSCHFCTAHGRRLHLLPDSDEFKKRKRNDINDDKEEWKEHEASDAEVEAYYKHDRKFREWCTKNPVIHPSRCHDCRMAQRGEESCPQCKKFSRWSQLKQCIHCQMRACKSCSSTKEHADAIHSTWKCCNACEGWMCGPCFDDKSGFVCAFCSRSLCGRIDRDECAQEQCGGCCASMCSDCVYRQCPHYVHSV